MTRHLTVVRPTPRPAKPCGHWLGQHKRDCGDPRARLYLCGWRCAAHTPSALAGRPEPPSIPLRTPEGTAA